MTLIAKNTNLQGIVLILLGALFLSVMDAVVKLLLDRGFSVMQILAVRSWMVVPVMAAWAWRIFRIILRRNGSSYSHCKKLGLLDHRLRL